MTFFYQFRKDINIEYECLLFASFFSVLILITVSNLYLKVIRVSNVFIVEDNISLQKIYELILTKNGFHVIGHAYNGEEAINAYKTFIEKPNFVIMDYGIPFKNGLEVTEEIIRLDHNVKIIFASADPTIKTQALLLGAKYFLTKPFSCKQLIQILNRFLMNSL